MKSPLGFVEPAGTRRQLTSSGSCATPKFCSTAPSMLLLFDSSGLSTLPLNEPAATVFEPIMPSTDTILGMGLIIVLCALVGWVWANQVVPTSRANLAISKSRGPVKEYLDELKASDPADTDVQEKALGKTEDLLAMSSSSFILENDPLVSSLNSSTAEIIIQSESISSDPKDRALERWLFTDWLVDNKSARRAGRQKDPALPILKDAKWNSGDNPVLAATALITLGVIFSAVTERVVFRV